MRIRKIIAIMLLAATVCTLCACAVKPEFGDSVTTNIARVYTAEDRSSHFVKNGVQIEGSVIGKAEMDVSAYSNTSLAWVDNMVVYFVSDKGVDQLGTAISLADISFDGSCACFFNGNKFMRYDVSTRESTVLEEGLITVTQIAISPSGKCVAMTAAREGETTETFVELFKDGESTILLKGKEASVIAISDDGETYYFIDEETNAFCVVSDGTESVISTECGASSIYNFSMDLSEVTYITNARSNRLFRLKDKLDVELCEGFGYTLKTDVYSIARGVYPAYINQVNSFTNGLWFRRRQMDGVNYYDIGFVNEKGGVKWLVEGCRKYEVLPEQSRILWLADNKLYSTGFGGRTKQLADEVRTFAAAGDGAYTFYISTANSLFAIKGKGKPKKLDTNVDYIETMGDRCFYIKDKANGEETRTVGKLCRTDGSAVEDVMENAVRFDKRCGQLMVYTEPAADGENTCYTVSFTSDGAEWKVMGTGVEP